MSRLRAKLLLFVLIVFAAAALAAPTAALAGWTWDSANNGGWTWDGADGSVPDTPPPDAPAR
jgi:hypothetical protein